MALFNYATKEITLKIVYYGPGLSGKTTNIEYLHSSLAQAKKGKLLSLSTEADRTLFFDFLPVEVGKIKDFSIRFQLYTVPGQVRYNATRRLVLKGADAVVFVADSQTDMRESNVESLENMRENLIANDLDPDEIPVILQFNKRDLPNVDSVKELNGLLNKKGYSYFEAVALKGQGVETTFKSVTKLLLRHIAQKHRIDIQSKDAGEEETIMSAPFAGEKSAAEELQETVVSAAFDEIPDPGLKEDPVSSDTGPETLRDPFEGLRNDLTAGRARSAEPSQPAANIHASLSRSSEEFDFKFEDNSVESIYKTFMSDEPAPSGIGEDQAPPIAKPAPSEKSDPFTDFKDSTRTPLTEDSKTGKQSPVPKAEKDIFSSMEELARTDETKTGQKESGSIFESFEKKPPIPKKETPSFSASPIEFGTRFPAGSEGVQETTDGPEAGTPSAMQNVILDEINSLSRTIRKVNDSLSAMKSEISLLSKKVEEVDRKFSSLNQSSTSIMELMKKGQNGTGSSEEISKGILSIRAAIEHARKKRFWIFFS